MGKILRATSGWTIPGWLLFLYGVVDFISNLDFVITKMSSATNFLSSPLGNTLLIIGGIIWIVAVIWSRKSDSLLNVIGQRFDNTAVPLDGHLYRDCSFNNVTFEWNGKGKGGLINPTITGSHRFQTQDGTIADAIDILKGLGFLETSFSADWKRFSGSFRVP